MMTEEQGLLIDLEKIPLPGINFRTPNVLYGITKIWRDPWTHNIRSSLKDYYAKYADGTNRPLSEICEEEPHMLRTIQNMLICQNGDDQCRWMAHTTVDRLCEMAEKYNIGAYVFEYAIIDAIQKTFKDFDLYEVPLGNYNNYLRKRDDGAIVLFTDDEWPPFVVDFASDDPPTEDLARALGGLKRFIDKYFDPQDRCTRDTYLHAAFDTCWEEWHKAMDAQSIRNNNNHPWLWRLRDMGKKIVPYLKGKLGQNDLSATWVLDRIFPNEVDAQELVQSEKIIDTWKNFLEKWEEKEEEPSKGEK